MCRDDFNRRWILFKYLVSSVMAYEVEIWGWEEKKQLEKIMMDYIRWIFRLDFCTPKYLIAREFDLEKLKIRWGIRARRFELKIKEMEEHRWVKKCWREKGKKGWKDIYGKERERYYNRNGWGIEEVERKDREEGVWIEEIIGREKDIQMQRENSKISEAKYNKMYRKLRKKGVGAKYLKEKNLNREGYGMNIRALVRLRCGNMEESNKY